MPITLRGQSAEIRLSNEEGHLTKGLSRRRQYSENANLRGAIEYALQMILEQKEREREGKLPSRQFAGGSSATGR